MLIIEGNAVYEVDCECLRRRWGRHQTIFCEEDLLSKDQVTVQTGGVCREQLSYTGRGVTVAILDTGLYPHPDFKDRIVGWYDAIGKEKAPVDPNGHGTQEGGIVCRKKITLGLDFFTNLCYSIYNRCLQKFKLRGMGNEYDNYEGSSDTRENICE